MYIYANVVFVKENIYNFNERGNIHTHNTRGKHDLDSQRCRISKTMNCHKHMQLKLYNKLPYSIRCTGINKFKYEMAKWLKVMAFYTVDDFMKCNLEESM